MIAASTVWFTLFIFNMLTFATEVIGFVIGLNITGIEGAPWWINFIIFVMPTIMLVIIIYRMVRKGDSSDES